VGKVISRDRSCKRGLQYNQATFGREKTADNDGAIADYLHDMLHGNRHCIAN